MDNEILGPFGEVLALRSALEEELGEPVGLDEEILLRRFIHELLASPGNREVVYQAALSDPLAPSFPVDDHTLVAYIAAQIDRGYLRLVRPAVHEERRARGVVTTGADETPEPPKEETKEEEPKIKDWKIECAHHASGGREFFERGTSIQLVPDKGQTKDKIKVHWRDDWQPSMPPHLAVRCAGKPDGKALQAGGSGGFTTYEYECAYHGDINNVLFPLPSFWSAFAEKTAHTIAPGPTSIGVQVFNPRQWKLEVSFPPLKGIKAGYKYDVQRETKLVGNKLTVASHTQVKEKETVEQTGWSKSSLGVPVATTVSSKDTWTNGVKDAPDDKETEKRIPKAIKLSRDGEALSLDVVELVASILKFIQEGLDIVKLVKDMAPKIGWYVDIDIQVLQGGIAAEMYWKEHTDKRVYRYVDVNLKVVLFSITFEFGVGVSAFSFKVQVFAQLSGELSMEISGKRTSPDGDVGVQLGPFKATIKGAIGARAEAGYVFKAEAKAETALEVDMVVGINQGRGGMFNLDGGVVWTGVQVSATGSVGLLGIGGTKKWEGTLIERSDRWRFEWPKVVKYQPKYMSRDAIATHLAGVLTDGWNIRVFTEVNWGLDQQWPASKIAGMLADRIERDKAFYRTPEMVQTLGTSIRQDLDRLGTRTGRDWIKDTDFEKYVNGSEMTSYLREGKSPLAGIK